MTESIKNLNTSLLILYIIWNISYISILSIILYYKQKIITIKQIVNKTYKAIYCNLLKYYIQLIEAANLKIFALVNKTAKSQFQCILFSINI